MKAEHYIKTSFPFKNARKHAYFILDLGFNFL